MTSVGYFCFYFHTANFPYYREKLEMKWESNTNGENVTLCIACLMLKRYVVNSSLNASKYCCAVTNQIEYHKLKERKSCKESWKHIYFPDFGCVITFRVLCISSDFGMHDVVSHIDVILWATTTPESGSFIAIVARLHNQSDLYDVTTRSYIYEVHIMH